MAKRSTPIRLDESLLKSLDRFVETWNRSGAPSTNRTFVITSAIKSYLNDWRPWLRRSMAGGKRGGAHRTSDRVLGFPHSPPQRPIRAEGVLRRVL